MKADLAERTHQARAVVRQNEPTMAEERVGRTNPTLEGWFGRTNPTAASTVLAAVALSLTEGNCCKSGAPERNAR